MASTKKSTNPAPTNAGLVLLQWLTYTFWGWTVLGLSALTWVVIASFITDADTRNFTPYGIAAVLVLLPISYLCDTLYSKREPKHKTGPETLVMVIHAVLFAVFGIGSLIFAVFSLVRLLTDVTDTDSGTTNLLSSLIIAAFYGLTFLRTVNPTKFPWVKRFYKFFMLVTISAVVILGIAGPVTKERNLRTDRLIEAHLPEVQFSIHEYANNNGALPENLDSIDLGNDAKKLLNAGLVTYRPNTKTPTMEDQTQKDREPSTSPNGSPSQVFYYQLCVTYKKASNDYGTYRYAPSTHDGEYTNYVDTYYHPSGDVCYSIDTRNSQ